MRLLVSAPNFSSLRNVADWVSTNLSSIVTSWFAEHKADGTHSNITTDDVTISGSVDGPFYDFTTAADNESHLGERFAISPTGYLPLQITATSQTEAGLDPTTAVSVQTSVAPVFAGANGYGVLIIPSFTEGGSGTHAMLASLSISSPTITGGSATVTNTAGLHIAGIGSATVTGRNWAIYAADGFSYFEDGLVERGRTAPIGEWTAVAFDAGNFTGNNSMTWTVASGDVVVNRYMLVGKTLFWNLQVATTTVGGTPDSELRVTIPGGFTSGASQDFRGSYAFDNGTYADLVILCGSGASHVACLSATAGFGAWAAATDATRLSFNIRLEIA